MKHCQKNKLGTNQEFMALFCAQREEKYSVDSFYREAVVCSSPDHVLICIKRSKSFISNDFNSICLSVFMTYASAY